MGLFKTTSFKEKLKEPAKQDDTNIKDIIYGKDPTQQVTKVEVFNDDMYVFFNDGTFEKRDYRYWFLTKKEGNNSIKLDGKQPFKYLNFYDDYSTYNECKSNAYKIGVFNVADVAEQAMMFHGITSFKGIKVQDVSVLSFDIEADGLMSEDMITPVVGKHAEVYIISNTFRDIDGNITKRLFSLDEYDNQYDMIKEWCEWVVEISPSIIAAHNGFGYDFPYLNYVWRKYSKENLPLGYNNQPLKFDDRTSKVRKDGSQSYDFYDIHCLGRNIIDTMFLAIKYDFKREYVSYGLKQIIKQEGLEKEDRQHYDASKISQNWDIEEEREKIKAYAVDDGDDALALYDLMIPSFFYYAQSIPMNFQRINNTATGTQINKLLIRSYLQINHSIPERTESEPFEGAISFGSPGFYENVRKVDVASLYPSIMRTYKVYNKKKDPKAHFLKMVDYFTIERLENKRLGKETGDRYYKDMEQSQKIGINSAYGLLGAKLNFNYPEGAAEVTRHGREILQIGVKWASGQKFIKVPKLTKTGKIKKKTNSDEPQMEWKLDGEITGKYRIVNVDTDSFSYTNGEAPIGDEFDKEIIEINSLYPDGIVWEDDGVFQKVIVVKAKNYVLDNGEKVKLKGSSLTDQKKEPALLEMQRKLIDKILQHGTQEELNEIYESYVDEAMNVSDMQRWVNKKTITKSVLEQTTPAQEKVFNALQGRHVQEGDKIWVFQDLDGEKPKVIKGEIQYYKDGRMKTVPNNILRMLEDFTGSYDKSHFVKRVYATLCILENVLDMDLFIDYTKKVNYQKLLKRYVDCE